MAGCGSWWSWSLRDCRTTATGSGTDDRKQQPSILCRYHHWSSIFHIISSSSSNGISCRTVIGGHLWELSAFLTR